MKNNPSISGNAPPEIKSWLLSLRSRHTPPIYLSSDEERSKWKAPGFASAVQAALTITEATYRSKTDEPNKKEFKTVFNLNVDEEMVNGLNNIHGGCSAFIVDVCSTLTLIAYRKSQGGTGETSVSQSLNMLYHSPAGLGDQLRVISWTMTVGGRAESVRTEIWNDTHHRLVASGVHIKMASSPAPQLLEQKAKAKL